MGYCVSYKMGFIQSCYSSLAPNHTSLIAVLTRSLTEHKLTQRESKETIIMKNIYLNKQNIVFQNHFQKPQQNWHPRTSNGKRVLQIKETLHILELKQKHNLVNRKKHRFVETIPKIDSNKDSSGCYRR